MSNSILDHPIISQRYFFPRREKLSDPFWVDGLACYYQNQHPHAKTIIHFHGNGEIVSDYIPDFAQVIAQMGYNCFLAEFRGYGMSGGKPSLVGMLADVKTIITATGQPPEQIVLFGRSVGSIYALHGISLFPNIAGLIIESGIADPLERILLRVRPEELGVTRVQMETAISKNLDHRHKLATYRGSSLIMHAHRDSLVDVSHAHRIHHWAPEPKQLKIFERGDHNSILFSNFTEYFEMVQSFLQNLDQE